MQLFGIISKSGQPRKLDLSYIEPTVWNLLLGTFILLQKIYPSFTITATTASTWNKLTLVDYMYMDKSESNIILNYSSFQIIIVLHVFYSQPSINESLYSTPSMWTVRLILYLFILMKASLQDKKSLDLYWG
jgi:hypothetical protein